MLLNGLTSLTLVLLTLATVCVGEAPLTGNFAISTSSCFFANVVVNPPTFSTYLAEVARGAELNVIIDGGPLQPASTLFTDATKAIFPECDLHADIGDGATLRWHAFAPLSAADAEVGFLPLLLGRVQLTLAQNAPPFSRNVTFQYHLWCGDDAGSRAACGGNGDVARPSSEGYAWTHKNSVMNATSALFVSVSGGFARGADCGIFDDRSNRRGPPTLCGTLVLEVSPFSPIDKGIVMVGHQVEAGRHASKERPGASNSEILPTTTTIQQRQLYKSAYSLVELVETSAPLLAAAHSAFIATIPTSGNKSIDESIRWWLQASIILTKGLGDRVITMGYVELNARDSFWTSFLHAYTWPSLEAIMLREMCEFACGADGGPPSYCQGGSSVHGKIPTCVLPTIVRDDNIDITGFFIQRLARYFESTGDEELLVELYPCLRNAIHYLQRRVPIGGALPAARPDSYWGSWEDVPFLMGRKTMVDNAALYLASLRAGARAALLLAMRLGTDVESRLVRDTYRDDARNFSKAYSAGHRELMSPVSEGGHWDTSIGYFRDSWWHSKPSNYTLGDVFMTVFFSIVGKGRAHSVIDYIASPNMSGLYGVRALFPYMPYALDPWGGYYPPGVYANGGSYAWMTCGSALAAGMAGRDEWAWKMWLTHTNQMLYTNGAQRIPYEYLHSETGAQMGNAPQGWSSVCSAFAWSGPIVRWARESPIWAQRSQIKTPEDPIEEGAPFSINEPGITHTHTYRLTIGKARGAELRKPFLLPCGSMPGAFIRVSWEKVDVIGTVELVIGLIASTDDETGTFKWYQEDVCIEHGIESGARLYLCAGEKLRVLID